MLLRHLPRESAYIQAIGGPRVRWGEVEHLIAHVIDLLALNNYLTLRAHFKGEPKHPTPFRRPGDPVATRPAGDQPQRFGNRSFNRADMAEILARWRAGKPQPEEVT